MAGIMLHNFFSLMPRDFVASSYRNLRKNHRHCSVCGARMKRSKLPRKNVFDRGTGERTTNKYQYWWACRWVKFEEDPCDVISLGVRDIKKPNKGDNT
jgi:hypothetical protein